VTLRFLAISLLIAGLVGCATTAPPSIAPTPAPEATATPVLATPTPAPPQPSASAWVPARSERIAFVPNRQSVFPYISSFDFTTTVGEPFELAATASKPGLAVALESDTPERAGLTTTVTDDGLTTKARLDFRQPGLVRLRMDLGGGQEAHFEAAAIDAATVSAPKLNAVPPTVIFDRIRLITNQEDWQAFWTASLRKDTSRSQETAPTVDFTQRSVVVIGHMVMERCFGPAAVTHVSGTDIHVAFPSMSEYMVIGNPAPVPWTVIQEIPRMPRDARFVFSGYPPLMFPPPDNEVVGYRPHDIPDPNPSLW
jgi:hypothetical protein